MRARLVVATVVVILVQAIVAWALFILSVHGPSGLAITSLIYVVVAWACTTWIASRYRSLLALLAIGLGSVAIAPGLVALLDRVERFQYDRQLAATQVTDVRDEPILSSKTGRPIGVRISYRVTVPKRGYFAITPWLSSRDPKMERLSVFPVNRTLDGSHDERRFEPGKTHAMVVELYPRPLEFMKGERCLESSWLVQLPESTVARPLDIMISETRYGATYRGAPEEHTTGAYDIAELYRGVVAEGLKPCSSPTPSP